ncbi:alpha-amylase family glycosyl hydrolase [Ideonella sp.]|uniref:alpha-amylase family glycosyl hydrolase n=1 Tax=Ideonella sp. TaxID=1929293 RepID=UPI0037C041BD
MACEERLGGDAQDEARRGRWQPGAPQRLAWLCGLWLVALLVAPWALAADAARGLRLHVPSPDWRDQIIYFAMTDRFADGDPSNNDQGAGEYRPGSSAYFQGGDLMGLRQRLGYVQGLGATALWITPPVLNQWWDGNYGGYHGYWTQDFTKVDPHLGSLQDYRLLSDALHRRGMYLVQDIVVNHTGNYFYIKPGAQAGQEAQSWVPHPGSRPTSAPTQKPFDMNDVRQPAHRAAGIYHWTTDITNYQDPHQLLNFQMGGLDDLNTANPVVRRALRQSYAHWIKEVGVDAYRVDTAFYVPPDYFADLLHAKDPKAPGLMQVARQTGRRDFFLFGEGFAIDKPYQDSEAKRIERYMTGPKGEALLPGMLNFPLYGSGSEVFGRGAPTAVLGDRITRMVKVHPRLHWMPSFVDNHDVDRALAGSSVRGLEQHLLALMSLPGIPVLYYGTEQGFTQPRAPMFAAARPDGQDQFNTAHPLYQRIAGLTALRKAHSVLRRGVPTVLAQHAQGPGALVYKMVNGTDMALVAFNTAPHPVLVDRLALGLPAGQRLEALYGLDGPPAPFTVNAQGEAHLSLPPHSGLVWRVVPVASSAEQAAAQAGAPSAVPQIAGQDTVRTVSGPFDVQGQGATPEPGWLWVVDGDLSQAQAVSPQADGRWQARVDTAAMIDPALEHRAVLWHPGRQQVSDALRFKVTLPWQAALRVDDPKGDDRGPTGRYVYPTDTSWGPHAQADIRQVRAEVAGGALRLSIQMNEITRSWSPALGFDHVMLTAFIELPGEPGGATVMPLQRGTLPEGMRWHRRLRVGGWSNALFADEGASATSEGRAITPAAALQVDATTHTIQLTLPASALGRRSTLKGARVWINTWDWDGGYRALFSAPRSHSFGDGGGDAQGPLWMDQVGPLTLP